MLITKYGVIKMSKKKIISAIERTIEETRAYQKQNPEDYTGIMAMNEHRRNLEARLDFYDLTHPGPLKVIAMSIVTPIGIVLSPVIGAGALTYVAGRAIYDKLRERYSTK